MDKNPYDIQSANSFALTVSVEDRQIGQLISQLNRELLRLREDAFHEEDGEESDYYRENTKQIVDLRALFQVESIPDFLQKEQQLNNSSLKKEISQKRLCSCCYEWNCLNLCKQCKSGCCDVNGILLSLILVFCGPVLVFNACCVHCCGQKKIVLISGKLLKIYSKYKRKAIMLMK